MVFRTQHVTRPGHTLHSCTFVDNAFYPRKPGPVRPVCAHRMCVCRRMRACVWHINACQSPCARFLCATNCVGPRYAFGCGGGCVHGTGTPDNPMKSNGNITCASQPVFTLTYTHTHMYTHTSALAKSSQRKLRMLAALLLRQYLCMGLFAGE